MKKKKKVQAQTNGFAGWMDGWMDGAKPQVAPVRKVTKQ